MAMLVLLNGPPASGKSTIADRLVAVRPLALDLDVDVIRGQLGGWLDQPTAAGLAARALATSMIETHLTAGHDVIVPQFLARPDFVVELERLAEHCGAKFAEIALMIDRATAIEAFDDRSHRPVDDTHRDAASLVARSSDPVGAVGAMYDRFVEFLRQRPSARMVRAIRGDVDATVALVEHEITEAGAER